MFFDLEYGQEDFDLKELGAQELLERWGLRIVGGPLRSSLKVSTGGESGIDDDLRIVDYVESTPGFMRAVPVLKHVFSEGLSVSSFRVRRPGEPLSRALVRQGWFDLARIAEGRIARRILDEYLDELEVRLSNQPLRLCASIG